MRGCNQLRAESFVIQPTRRTAVTRRVASEWIRQLTERTSEAVEANAVQSTMIRERQKNFRGWFQFHKVRLQTQMSTTSAQELSATSENHTAG